MLTPVTVQCITCAQHKVQEEARTDAARIKTVAYPFSDGIRPSLQGEEVSATADERSFRLCRFCEGWCFSLWGVLYLREAMAFADDVLNL